MQVPIEPRFLIVGQVVRPHGVRGEIRVRVLTGYPDRFMQLESVRLGRDPEADAKHFVEYEVEGARLHQGGVILKLADLDDRNEADALRGQYVMVSLDHAVPLEEGEYYHFQLIGLEMVTDQGESIGNVVEILETGANDVYVVRGERYGEVLVPAIESVVQTIDLAARRITIIPISGLLPDRS